MAQHDIDTVTGTATTGHEWDGIKELNTPLPRWWLYVFYATIVWGMAYSIVYPAWPTLRSYSTGFLGYSSREQHNKNMETLMASRAVWSEKIASTPIADIAKNPDLLAVAVAGGKTVFANNCAPCHGTAGVGRPGFPSLVDDEWIWGGSLDAIQTTISHGIRNTLDPDTRQSVMPSFGADGLLTQPQIAAVADYVLSLSGSGTANKEGAAIFAEQCSACHGELGQGNAELGAPSLRDKIWLYGSGKQDLIAQITRPRLGVMPPWNSRLSPVEIKQAALYVHTLGGGQ